MDDLGPLLSPLADRGFADPPPLADLEYRAHRLRHRRWAGRSAGGAAVAIALVAGALALVPGREWTVRTAAGPGLAPAVLKEFDAVGHHWQLLGDGSCVVLRNEGGGFSDDCWPENPDPGRVEQVPVRARIVDLGGVRFLFGMVSKEVRTISLDQPGGLAVDVLGRDAGLPVNFFGVVLDFKGVDPVGVRVRGDGFDIEIGRR